MPEPSRIKKRAQQRQSLRDENAYNKKHLRMAKEIVDDQGQDIVKLQKELIRLHNDLSRVSSELEAEKKNVQMLGDNYNEKSRSVEKDVLQLRDLLKAHKIPLPR